MEEYAAAKVGAAETRDHRCFYLSIHLVFVLTTMLHNINQG